MRKAFTLVELIVVITILAILGTIAFISLQGYTREARDAKRLSDVNNLIKKINVERTKGVYLSNFMSGGVDTATGLTLGGTIPTESKQGKVNFLTIKEEEKNFTDPNGKDYVLSYAIGGIGTGAYKFIQLATINEEKNEAVVVGDYYKLEEPDSESLVFTDPNNTNLGYVVNNGSSLPYSTTGISVINSYIVAFELNGGIGQNPDTKSVNYNTAVGTLPSTPTRTGYTFTGWFTEISGGTQITTATLITSAVTYYAQWSTQWSGDATNGYSYKDSMGNYQYPLSCNDLLVKSTWKNTFLGSPWNGTNFNDGVYYVKPDTNPEFKVYCDMTTDGGGWILASSYNNGVMDVNYSTSTGLISHVSGSLLSLETRFEAITNTRTYKRFLKNNNIHGLDHDGDNAYFASCKLQWSDTYSGDDWGVDSTLQSDFKFWHALATNKGSNNYKYSIVTDCHRSLKASDGSTYKSESSTYYSPMNAYCGGLKFDYSVVKSLGCIYNTSGNRFVTKGPEGGVKVSDYEEKIANLVGIKIWVK